MKLKEVKTKSESLSFFLNFIDISKIRVLQLLNKELKKLENIQNLKASNLNLLNAIEERWFLKRGLTYFERDTNISGKLKKNANIYFVVDPKKIDIYTQNMLKKMEETLARDVTPDDYVVTFGSHVNMICQKLELHVVEHFDYSSFENIEDLSEKISSLIEIGIKNNLFSRAIMMITQSISSHSDPIVRKQILPFESIITKSSINDPESEEANNIKELNNKTINNYKDILSKMNIGKAEWNPDIFLFHEQFTKTIVKQSVHEMKVISNVEQYNLELQLLEEKKNKLTEQQHELTMLYNKARKEESTMQSLLLYSAFKIRQDEEPVPLFKVKGSVE